MSKFDIRIPHKLKIMRFRAEQVFLLLTFTIALIIRIALIGSYGLSEDEVLKALATRDYLNLDFTSNAQHPALSKLLITASVILLGETEFALRLPNAIFGSLTVYPLFYLGKELFDKRIAYISSIFWAVDIPTIAFATTAKEDTLLTFFWIMTTYYTVKAINNPVNYKIAGLMFGLTVASKYTGIILLLFLPSVIYLQTEEENSFRFILSKMKTIVLFSIPSFLLFNFPIFLPNTITKVIAHHFFLVSFAPSREGYIMMGTLFRERPNYYLLLYLFTKFSSFIIVFFIVGLILTIQKQQTNGLISLSWIIIPLTIFTFTGGFTRYALVFHPPLFFLAGVAIIRLSTIVSYKIPNIKILHMTSFNPNRLNIILTTIIIFHSLISGILIFPYYRMYVNEIGGGNSNAGYYFPQDSVYDYEIKEAIEYINQRADFNSTVAMEVPIIGEYYGRSDLNFYYTVQLPDNVLKWDYLNIDYVIVQESRIYIEDKIEINYLRDHYQPIKIFKALDITIVEIYYLGL